MAGVWVVVGVLVLGTLTGLLLRARDGRVRTPRPAAASSTLPAPVAELLRPDDAITLVQVSTTFCAPCRHARVLLADLAGRTEGLRHVELDVTERPEVARQLGVLRTPTTLALAPDGRELLRIGGVPERQSLLTALRPHLPEPVRE